MGIALQKGEVDAIVKSSLSRGIHEKQVELFAENPYYIIVKKGNARLLSEINYALDQLNHVEGDWKAQLYRRYYGSKASGLLPFSDEEKMLLQSYVANDVFLQVFCDPACYPYSYVENGEMKGIVPAYFRRVAASIGLPYQFVICRSREEWLAYRNRGDCDIILDGRLDAENVLEKKDWVSTKPYMTLRVAQVFRQDFDGNIQTVATVNQDISDPIEELLQPKRQEDQLSYERRRDAGGGRWEGGCCLCLLLHGTGIRQSRPIQTSQLYAYGRAVFPLPDDRDTTCQSRIGGHPDKSHL